MNTLTKNNNESIKELKGKLKTLSNSLIEQRNKNKDYITRINELETEIYKSNLQNDTIHNENYEIQNQINISKNPNENEEDSIMKNVANLFNTDNINFDKFDEVQNEIENMKYENKKLLQKYSEVKEQHDQQKIKYDTMLQIESQKCDDLTKKIKKYKDDIEQLSKQKIMEESLKKEEEKNKKKYEEKILELKKDINDMTNEYQNIQTQINQLKSLIEDHEKEMEKFSIDVKISNEKLEQYEELLKPKKLELVQFKVISIPGQYLNNDEPLIVTLYEKDTNEIVIQFSDKEYDIKEFKARASSNKSERVYIEKDGKKDSKQNFIIIMNELLVDYFVYTFNKYHDVAISRDEI